MARTRASARVLTEHDEIRDWAEERNAKPACARGTGGGNEVGMLRLEFPAYSGDESLAAIDWDNWFEKFDQRNLALLVQDQTARGQKSNFNKLVSRKSAAGESNRGRGSAPRGRRSKTEWEESSAQGEEFSSDAYLDEEEVAIENRPAAARNRRSSAEKKSRAKKSTAGARSRACKSSTARRHPGQRASVRATSRQRSSVTGRSSTSQKKPANAEPPERWPERVQRRRGK